MKTYTQEEVDELVAIEEQKGYDSGRRTGIQNGLDIASHLVMQSAQMAFSQKMDEKASFLRDIAREIKEHKV